MSTALESWSAGVPFSSPIPVSLYPLVANLCITGGLTATGMFVVQSKNTLILQQFRTAFLASFLLGFGAIFTSIAIGIYL
ncbi:unnamed protein product [Cunninghamella blakesleeana]